MKTFKDIGELIEKAKKFKGENKYYPCEINLHEDNEDFKAYEVSICNRDLLFFTDKGTVNYTIDTVGKDYLILEHIDKD